MTNAPLEPGLRRELGRWDLTAIGINQVIGAGVFAQQALLVAQAGAWSTWMVAVVGLASMLIALSFAEVGSRFEGTGGPYLYTRAAFGRFAAFEGGWMLWFTRAASWAAVINVLATSLGFYWPAVTSGAPRAALITVDPRNRSVPPRCRSKRFRHGGFSINWRSSTKTSARRRSTSSGRGTSHANST